MTPKEKAEDLVNKFRLSAVFTNSYVKAIAKTAVDEILNEYREDYEEVNKDIYTIYSWWQEVKQEIENL